MKLSIGECSPVFNTNRMVAEYAQKAYAPAAASWRRLRQDNLAPARDQAAWLGRVASAWDGVKVVAVEDTAGDAILAGTPIQVTARIMSASLSPSDLRVDILHGTADGTGELVAENETPMTLIDQTEDGNSVFCGSFAPEQGGNVGYAIRILPWHPDLHSPFVTGLARWG